MTAKELIEILNKVPPFYTVYIPMVFEDLRALYEEPYNGAETFSREHVKVEDKIASICFGCSKLDSDKVFIKRLRKQQK
jgi:hypothetical protein